MVASHVLTFTNQLVKPGAGQGSPLRVAPGVPLGMGGGDPEPCTERYWSKLLHAWGGSPTSRWPFHRHRLQPCPTTAAATGPTTNTLGPRAKGTGRTRNSSTRGWRGSGNSWLAPPRRYGVGSGGEAAVVVAAAGEGQGTCGQCTRWRASCSTCSGRLPVIMQRQVLQSCTESVIDVGWCLSFSSSTEFFLVVNRDRYPQLRFSTWVSGVAVH